MHFLTLKFNVFQHTANVPVVYLHFDLINYLCIITFLLTILSIRFFLFLSIKEKLSEAFDKVGEMHLLISTGFLV